MNEEKYNSVNGVIYKLDTFKGKKALVGDYSVASYYNTTMVLDSLGIEYEIVGTIEDIKIKYYKIIMILYLLIIFIEVEIVKNYWKN